MMLDEATTELLSRHMDGDLAASEERLLQQMLAEQPALQQELTAMLELRDSVRALAEKEEPPVELSALLEPLRRSPPPPVTIRPLYRWLAAAAMLCLGITVAMEVAQRNPGPTISPPSTSVSPVHHEPFRLQPLPTPKDGEEMVGAIDRLLANPPPEEQLESPPPLEVIGPVEEPPPGDEMPAHEPFAEAPEPEGAAGQSPSPPGSDVVDASPSAAQAWVAESADKDRFAAAPEHLRDEPAPPAAAEEKAARGMAEKVRPADTKRVALREREVSSRAAASDCLLVLLVAEQRLELPCEPGDQLLSGSYPVAVTVANGGVSRLELLHDGMRDDTAGRLSHACSRFSGRSLGLGDGTYTSRVIVR